MRFWFLYQSLYFEFMKHKTNLVKSFEHRTVRPSSKQRFANVQVFDVDFPWFLLFDFYFCWLSWNCFCFLNFVLHILNFCVWCRLSPRFLFSNEKSSQKPIQKRFRNLKNLGFFVQVFSGSLWQFGTNNLYKKQ